MNKIDKLELHYMFGDGSHTMDAIVKNRCETEILSVIYEAIAVLSLDLKIDSEALQEGGIKEAWKVLGRNNAQIALIVSVIALVFSQLPKSDSELIDLQKDELRLSIEEKKLIIDALRKELKEGSVSDETIRASTDVVNNNFKVVTRKSNFYRNLAKYSKVKKVGFSALDLNGDLVGKELIVERNAFPKFILQSHELKPLIVNEAFIEIVAPVLNEGTSKWKGKYGEELSSISFSMNDMIFKQNVVSRNVSFKNGDAILAVLKIHKKLDETGEVITSGYSVETVIETISMGVSSETKQGNSFRFTKKQRDDQSELFVVEN